MSRLPARKKRRLSPPDDPADAQASSDTEARTVSNEDLYKHTSGWDLEQGYESRPRKRKDAKESSRLPIKTADGRIQAAAPILEEVDDAESSEDSAAENGDDGQQDDGAPQSHLQGSVWEQILQAKEEFARIASLINEDPEENIGSLRNLAVITASPHPVITKLGLATQLAIYKDLIPGYRIRPLTEEDTAGKLSKDVRKLRNFEQSLVTGYQNYVKELARIAALGKQNPSEITIGLVQVAVSCACNLINAVPHFNFRTELLKILVSKLAGKMSQNFLTCQEAMETLFSSDDDGNASLEAVTMLSKMMKSKDFHINEGALNTFLHLRLLSEFSKKGSFAGIDKEDVDDAQQNGKIKKSKREFWTKKQRKLVKERKAIEKQFKEADAVVSHEDRDQKQAETLKLVFATYFRILKTRTPSLMGAVLEGLAKYAHLINQDFFGDILEALKELILDTEPLPNADQDENREDEEEEAELTAEDLTRQRNATRESLLCIVTAFALLQGQDVAKSAATLHLDLNFFISHLYRTLYPSSLDCAIEHHITGPKSSAAKVQHTARLLTQALNYTLLPPIAPHSTPPLRLAAFTKAVLTSSLQVPEKTCASLIKLMLDVVKMHKRKIVALWNSEERKGDGVYDGMKADLEGSNPFAATVWEGELLRLHYCPTVRDVWVKNIEPVVGETS